MAVDLTEGSVTKKMMLFSLPLIAGNLLQQTYNIADTLIVGKFLGADALAAVGSSYTLMTFLTSILLGLCMGSGALFSIRCGGSRCTGSSRVFLYIDDIPDFDSFGTVYGQRSFVFHSLWRKESEEIKRKHSDLICDDWDHCSFTEYTGILEDKMDSGISAGSRAGI